MLITGQVAVSDEPQQILADASLSTGGNTVTVVNQSTTTTVFLGPDDVDTDTGFRLLPGAGFTLDDIDLDDVWVVADAGLSGTLDFLFSRND